MNVLDLFSGIGGFSLGLERAGMRTVAFCEIEPYPRAVLAKHWPNVPCYDDVRTLTADRLRADGIIPDVICGGFPCQDISLAGDGAGIDGARSGLWREYARLIGEIRPRYVIVENVAALLGRGLGRVLGDLASLGYDAEWHCIPAAAVGAQHRRDRIWIVAHPSRDGHGANNRSGQNTAAPGSDQSDRHQRERLRRESGRSGENVADALRAGLPILHEAGNGGQARRPILSRRELERAYSKNRSEQWGAEPAVGRVANGVPSRVDRLKSLGNSIVPQVPEIIGRAIMQAEGLAQ